MNVHEDEVGIHFMAQGPEDEKTQLLQTLLEAEEEKVGIHFMDPEMNVHEDEVGIHFMAQGPDDEKTQLLQTLLEAENCAWTDSGVVIACW